MLSARIVDQDTLHPASAAVYLFPFEVSKSTVIRWMKAGVLNSRGERIILKSEWVGGRRCTSLRWVTEFRLRFQDETTPQPLTETTVAQRRERVKELLDAMLG